MSRFKQPFYISYDDLHNTPYIAGPYTWDEIRKLRLPDDVDDEFIEDLLEMGFAEWDGGERYELWNAEKLEDEIKEQLEIIKKIRALEKLP
jgi:hypothetical protein